MDSAFITRAPGVAVIVRDERTIQFGLDAARAGLIAVGDAAAVAAVLRRHGPNSAVGIEALTAELTDAGITRPAAEHLVQEFLDYGLWTVSSPAPRVALYGQSPLADSLAEALHADGTQVIRPRLIRPDAELPATMPLVLVDVLDEALEVSTTLVHSGLPRTWLPVTGLDTRVLAGPLHRAGRGPCLLCLNLYRTALDPLWPRLVHDIRGQWPAADQQVLAAATSHVVIALRALTGRSPLPGATPVRWMPGELHEIDPFGTTHQRFYEPHPRCPACFGTTIENPFVKSDADANDDAASSDNA